MDWSVGASKHNGFCKLLVIFRPRLAGFVCFIQVDILHPLATLEWTQGRIFCSDRGLQCIYLNGKLYMGIRSALLCFSSNFSEYDKLSVPVEEFALTHYHSQLVLVGGVKPGTRDATNELSVSADGTNWQLSLPPMKIRRSCASAINTGCPECCLVVAGGRVGSVVVCCVEILVGEEWFTVQCLPNPPNDLRSYMHYRMLIIADTSGSGYCCSVDSLISSRFQPQEDKKALYDPLWKKFNLSNCRAVILSFGRQLVAIESNIEVFCPSTHTWLKVGSVPERGYATAGMVLPTGEIVVIGEINSWDLFVYRASLKCK